MTKNNDKRETLLLVDDNSTNLQVLRQTLQGIDCKMLIAKNGERALSIAVEDHPDLILLDIMMPGIDGFEVCRRLKSDTATEDIPVIFLSALGDTEDKVRGLQLGGRGLCIQTVSARRGEGAGKYPPDHSPAEAGSSKPERPARA